MARVGIRNNQPIYYPYLLTCMGMTAMIYILIYLANCQMVKTIYGSATLQAFLYFGLGVAVLMALLIILYANGFVIKRRHKELGLYNILGLEKRHIAVIMFFEMIYSFLAGWIGGVGCGLLFSKLMQLLLTKLVRLPVTLDFEISVPGILISGLILALILFLAGLYNVKQVYKARPVELMASENAGEREPKTRWIMTAVGIITLATGYLMALKVQDSQMAIALFFIAVTLVIIGTHCLFNAGSIALLKLMRANKKYYYQPAHFINVSGMLYRMKQNASGLAHICILCTMVLVTVATTVTMYQGTQANINDYFPSSYNVRAVNLGFKTDEEIAGLQQAIRQQADQSGLTVDDMWTYRWLYASGYLNGNRFSNQAGSMLQTSLVVISQTEYQKATSVSLNLQGSAIACAFKGLVSLEDKLIIGDQEYRVSQIFDTIPDMAISAVRSETNVLFVVVADQPTADAIGQTLGTMEIKSTLETETDLLVSPETEAVIGFTRALCNSGTVDNMFSYQEIYSMFYSTFGGFMFLGIIFAVMFLMVTALIMYYKQLSEGYQDRRRYEIMQQVGMTAKEVRGSITSQILLVFFLPLAVAGIHVLASFNMISRMLTVFSIDDGGLFASCTLLTFAGFAIIYLLVYLATSRTYYKIVSLD